jgi:hypothetical protein
MMSADLSETTEYVSAAELAKQHQVSNSTIRRRIAEGRLFPGAKLVDTKLGKRWLIPRAEIESKSLEDVSQKRYLDGRSNQVDGPRSSWRQDLRRAKAARSLEDRVAILERLLLECLDRLDPKDNSGT